MYEDNFYFFDENNNTFSNSLNFMKLELGDKNYSFVGLQLPDNLEIDLLTFPKALKQNKIINNYVFFIYYNKYQNNDEIPSYNGNIYFGEYPHNIKEFSNEFKENNFYEIRASNRSNFVYWDILFDNIYFGPNDNNNKKEYKQAEILGNTRLSIGTEEYKVYISKNFFDIYVKNKICQLKIVINNSDYEYYQCFNNKLFNISQFPSLKFEIKEINFIFSLNYKDLFFIHNNYIYFSIIFDRYFKLKYNKRWRLGSPLFKKYLLTFNQDTRMIGIYKNIMRNSLDDEVKFNNDKGENNNKDRFKNNDNNKKIIKLLIIICLLILIVLIILFIKKYIKSCNKKTNSKDIDFIKSEVGHDSKNKNIVHEYYELGNNLVEK